MPDEFSEKPRILVLACENDAYPGARHGRACSARLLARSCASIPVRCLGSVNTIWITDALNAGYDGVMMMGCKNGDDYQCHFVKGSELARVPDEQDRRHAEAAGARDRARRDLRSRDHRHRRACRS